MSYIQPNIMKIPRSIQRRQGELTAENKTPITKDCYIHGKLLDDKDSKKQCLCWLGHVLRLSFSRSTNQALNWMPAGQRKKGPPRMNGQQTVERDLCTVSRKWSKTRRLAVNCTQWNVLPASCIT